ncbi:hypothetical protein ACT3TS_02720 [Specibacter sp. AOP5-B1-6]|uniref:hypothetical protein n=1 Tax=Specibacter sp. AOP5-B1-6 TaxID=3457653 RepID=UPI00402BB78C
MSNSSRSRFILAAVLALAAVATASCAPPALLSSADAQPRYEKLAEELAQTLELQYLNDPWVFTGDGDSEVQAVDHGTKCTFYVASRGSGDDVASLAGGWDAVMETINPVLAEHGFSEIAEEDSIAGGYTGISSKDDHGARVRIVSKGSTELSLSADVTDKDC